MMATYEYHSLKAADSKRIQCQAHVNRLYARCRQQAIVSQYMHWDTGNTKGLSFFYYCAKHDPRHKEEA